MADMPVIVRLQDSGAVRLDYGHDARDEYAALKRKPEPNILRLVLDAVKRDRRPRRVGRYRCERQD